MTLEVACSRLGIAIDSRDPLLLVDAVRCDEDSIGVHNGCLLICASDEFQFFVEPLSDLATRMLDAFHDGQGCAVYYYSTPGLYGYAHFKGRLTLRVKYGSHDKVWVDVGASMSYEGPWSEERSIEGLTEQVIGMPLPQLLEKEIPMFPFQLIGRR